jgi:hypothetical protein
VKKNDTVLVHEALESDLIERLHGKWRDTAARLRATELQVLLLCYLMAEEIEQKITPAYRRIVRDMVADTFEPVGNAVARVVQELDDETH